MKEAMDTAFPARIMQPPTPTFSYANRMLAGMPPLGVTQGWVNSVSILEEWN